jgi:hypothetical protein
MILHQAKLSLPTDKHVDFMLGSIIFVLIQFRGNHFSSYSVLVLEIFFVLVLVLVHEYLIIQVLLLVLVHAINTGARHATGIITKILWPLV